MSCFRCICSQLMKKKNKEKKEKKENKADYFGRLPNEVLDTIFGHLSKECLFENVLPVCRRFYSVVKNKRWWNDRIEPVKNADEEICALLILLRSTVYSEAVFILRNLRVRVNMVEDNYELQADVFGAMAKVVCEACRKGRLDGHAAIAIKILKIIKTGRDDETDESEPESELESEPESEPEYDTDF